MKELLSKYLYIYIKSTYCTSAVRALLQFSIKLYGLHFSWAKQTVKAIFVRTKTCVRRVLPCCSGSRCCQCSYQVLVFTAFWGVFFYVWPRYECRLGNLKKLHTYLCILQHMGMFKSGKWCVHKYILVCTHLSLALVLIIKYLSLSYFSLHCRWYVWNVWNLFWTASNWWSFNWISTYIHTFVHIKININK